MGIRNNRISVLSSTILATALAGSLLFSAPVGAQQRAEEPLDPAVSTQLCNFLLDQEAAMAYDADGITKLLATPRACPTGVSLNETLVYVDKLLDDSFDDPYTVVSPPDVAKHFQSEMAGTEEAFAGGGIGLALSFDPSKLMPADPKAVSKDGGKAEPRLAFTGLINHAFKTGPAAKAGIHDGDVITKVDDQVVTGLDPNHVVGDLMRGPIGSKIKVTVQRGDKELSFTMTREKVVSDNVWSRDLGNGVYSIVVTEFRANTAANIYNEMLKHLGEAKGFVIDVRGNPGGLLDEAILSAAWFVHDGVIVSQRERVDGDPSNPGNPQYVKITYTREGGKVVVTTVDEATGKVLDTSNIKLHAAALDPKTGKPGKMIVTDKVPFLGFKPVVVLADGMSASAAEVFTGAVSENVIAGPATVLGTRPVKTDRQGAVFTGAKTFGKFIGQTVGGGPMGVQVKATSFRYFSPKGEWLGDAHKHRIGLTPSVPVSEPETAVPYTASDAQLMAAVKLILNGGQPASSTP